MSAPRIQVARAFIDLADTKGYQYAVESLAAFAIQTGLDVDLLLKDIARELESRGELTIELQSARRLSETSKKDLAVYLHALTNTSHSHISESINPELIGGVRAITAEYELDWTVRGRLDRLMKQGGHDG